MPSAREGPLLSCPARPTPPRGGRRPYHFHHSEDVTQQDRGLGLLRALRKRATPAWHAYVERSIKGWTNHRDIVARFDRFPHRNAVLGRLNTTEEAAFLAAEGNSFGQRLLADNTTC